MLTFTLLAVVMITNFLLLSSKIPQRIGIAAGLNTMVLVTLLGLMVAQWGESGEWMFYIPLVFYNVLPMYVVIFLFSVLKPVNTNKFSVIYGKKM
ncbi:hypothetical protein ACQCN2_06025 [Brevibacillus ginsengisoli]|uniref:hypothetical protein n=1 Tax=Brevibacillus ginsengisoli TaxID=363854 RepID=UPI003CFADB06